MLSQFKFKNHKCFYDETILDLMATQEKRHLESTINVNSNNILPIIAIHGANASMQRKEYFRQSGKTRCS